MAFFSTNTKKEIVMTKKDEEDYKNEIFSRFSEKEMISDKVRDHCHLTCKYRGAAHSISKIIVTQEQNSFKPFAFHNLSNYDLHLFFKKLVDEKNDRVKIDITPKTHEEYISITYAWIRFIDSYRVLSSSLDEIVKTLVDISNKTLKKLKEEIADTDEILNTGNEMKILIEEDRCDNGFKKDFKKEDPNKSEKVEEALLNYMGKMI